MTSFLQTLTSATPSLQRSSVPQVTIGRSVIHTDHTAGTHVCLSAELKKKKLKGKKKKKQEEEEQTAEEEEELERQKVTHQAGRCGL